jgi:hypothetical protein
MLAVGDQRRRTPTATDPDQQHSDGGVQRRRHRRDRQADADPLERIGMMNLCTALTRITAAATKIIRPSAPAEKYSALPCP